MSGSRTKVTIDRLVLRGVDSHHAKALAESLKRALARTLSQPGSQARLQRAQDAPVMKVGRVQMNAGRAGAQQLGSGIARAIGKRVGK